MISPHPPPSLSHSLVPPCPLLWPSVLYCYSLFSLSFSLPEPFPLLSAHSSLPTTTSPFCQQETMTVLCKSPPFCEKNFKQFTSTDQELFLLSLKWAVEARWAHNPEVDGLKPFSAILYVSSIYPCVWKERKMSWIRVTSWNLNTTCWTAAWSQTSPRLS